MKPCWKLVVSKRESASESSVFSKARGFKFVQNLEQTSTTLRISFALKNGCEQGILCCFAMDGRHDTATLAKLKIFSGQGREHRIIHALLVGWTTLFAPSLRSSMFNKRNARILKTCAINRHDHTIHSILRTKMLSQMMALGSPCSHLWIGLKNSRKVILFLGLICSVSPIFGSRGNHKSCAWCHCGLPWYWIYMSWERFCCALIKVDLVCLILQIFCLPLVCHGPDLLWLLHVIHFLEGINTEKV